MSKKNFKPPLLLLSVSVLTLIVFSAVLTKGQIFTLARGTFKAQPSTIQVVVVRPNGGEQFQQGTANLIEWKGGNRFVAVGLVKPEADTTFDIASTGMIIGWINTNEGDGSWDPNSSATWTALQVCDLSLDPGLDTGCKPVSPGNYKILVWSEDENLSWYIGSGTGPSGKYTKKDKRGNWDVSDQAFTIYQ